MPRSLHLISLNHSSASTMERMDLNLNEVEWFHLEAFARFSLGVIGWVNISTCNRIEILLDAPTGIDIDLVIDKWIRLSKNQIDSNKFDIISGNLEVIQYLLELSTGLRPIIEGDDQILTQLKQAFEASRTTESGLSALIVQAYLCMMRCHEEITGSNSFSANGASLAHFALKYVRIYINNHETITYPKILIIGAGNMAKQVLKYLPKTNIGEIFLTNRSIDKAKLITKGTNIQVIENSHLHEINPEIIISCTEHGYEMVNKLYQPQLLVDFSMRSAAINENNFELLDLNTMQQSLTNCGEIRQSSRDNISAIISKYCGQFKDWTVSWQENQLRY